MTSHIRALSVSRARVSISSRYAPILAGVALGAYLSEFLAFNQDFVGPQTLSIGQMAGLTLVIGPGLMMAVWLLSAWLGARYLRLSLAEGLDVDAPSYWPVIALALAPAAALLLRAGPSAYQAAVVVMLTVVLAAMGGLKVYRWSQAAARDTRSYARIYRRGLILAGATFAVVIGMLAILGYRAYTSWYLDLALVDQALWNTLHGRFMEYSFYQGIQMSLLADHVEPILLALLPVYVLWPDPQALLLVRVLALLAAALPIYGIVVVLTNSRTAAAMFVLAFLASPAVIDAGIHGGGNIRTEMLALPILAVAVYAALSARWKLLYIAAVLAMLCKEHISLLIIGLGFYLLVSGKSRKHGLWLACLGAAWFIFAVYVFLPWIRHGEPSRHFALSFAAFGGSEGATGVMRTFIAHPGQVLASVLTESKLSFLFFSLLSFAFLPLIGGISAVALPIVGLFMLYPTTPTLLDYHYLPALPFLMAGAALGISKLARRIAAGNPAKERSSIHGLAAMLLVCTLSASFFWGAGPLSWGFWRADRPYAYIKNHYALTDHVEYVNNAVQSVPQSLPVIASDYLLIRLAQRPFLYQFFAPPPSLDGVEYGIIDLFENHVRTPETRQREKQLQAELLTGGEFALMAAEDGVLRFARSNAPGLATEVQVITDPKPQHVIEAVLGERLKLLGYDFTGSERLASATPYRITYYWEILPGFADPFEIRPAIQPESLERLTMNYAIVDTLRGSGGDYRIIHLPTYITVPPDKWSEGQILQESYEFVLPENLPAGAYEWSVGLYAEPSWFGIRTDEAGLVPGSRPVRMGEIMVTSDE